MTCIIIMLCLPLLYPKTLLNLNMDGQSADYNNIKFIITIFSHVAGAGKAFKHIH